MATVRQINVFFSKKQLVLNSCKAFMTRKIRRKVGGAGIELVLKVSPNKQVLFLFTKRKSSSITVQDGQSLAD